MAGIAEPLTTPTIVSAPGKVLLAGGYLVLDEAYTGTVVATTARFYTLIRQGGVGTNTQSRIVVKSPQFIGATWEYVVDEKRDIRKWNTKPANTNLTDNKFVRLAVQRVLLLATEIHSLETLREITGPGFEVIIVADNDFYSQQGQADLDDLESDTKPNPKDPFEKIRSVPRFNRLQTSISEVHKTGLGSSAALVASLTCALMIQFQIIPPTPNMTPENRALVHNTAQFIHCLAQGKVGSGFDIASATYGSQIYRRFDHKVLDPLMQDTEAKLLLKPHLDGSVMKWDHEIRPFRLPPYTRLLLADVDAGSDTRTSVSKLMAWKKDYKPKSNQSNEATNSTKSGTSKAGEQSKVDPLSPQYIYATLATNNDAFTAALQTLSSLHEKNKSAYERAVMELIKSPPVQWANLNQSDQVIASFTSVYKASENIREQMRRMTKESGVPIEPEPQTELLDACVAKPGVVCGGVPGAGGFDAVWVLVLEPPPNAPRTGKTPMQHAADAWVAKLGNTISPLLSSESTGMGLRLEGPEVFQWFKEAKYV